MALLLPWSIILLVNFVLFLLMVCLVWHLENYRLSILKILLWGSEELKKNSSFFFFFFFPSFLSNLWVTPVDATANPVIWYDQLDSSYRWNSTIYISTIVASDMTNYGQAADETAPARFLLLLLRSIIFPNMPVHSF